MEFEKAQIVKDKLALLERYQGKSIVVNPAITNVDVFSVLSNENNAYVNYMKVINGAIIQSHTIEIKKKLDETNEELLALSVIEFRQRFSSDSSEIILPLMLETAIPRINITVPQKGDKKQLLELSERNARYYMMEKQKAERSC